MCFFDDKFFPLATNSFSPFNSQNTFFSREALKKYLVIPHIGRMDDIWAAYYVQAKNNTVVFHEASVYQDRNIHDLIKDMKQEYMGYENNLKMVNELPQNPDAILSYLPEKSKHAFELYKKHFK